MTAGTGSLRNSPGAQRDRQRSAAVRSGGACPLQSARWRGLVYGDEILVATRMQDPQHSCPILVSPANCERADGRWLGYPSGTKRRSADTAPPRPERARDQRRRWLLVAETKQAPPRSSSVRLYSLAPSRR